MQLLLKIPSGGSCFKCCISILLGFLLAQSAIAQINSSMQWSWRAGISSLVVRGPLGVASTAYTPGYRRGATQFKDPNGNMWIYGGIDASNLNYADLWFYNITTDEWTWVSGSATTNAAPVYGSYRSGADSTFPGNRFESYGWYDSRNGKLWLYGGGVNNPQGWRNDLWSYDIQTHIWAWMAGSGSINVPWSGSNTASPANTPGGRSTGCSWYVNNNIDPFQSFTGATLPARDCAKLYLAFGYGVGPGGATGQLNNIWVFNTDDLNWMYLATGSTSVNGTPTSPGAREGAAYWSRVETAANIPGTGSADRDFLYSMGGYGQGSNGYGFLNDIWKYDVLKNKWFYVSGSYTISPASGSTPGGIWKSSADMNDAKDKVYLFNEQGNSTWQYSIDAVAWSKLFADAPVSYGTKYGQSSTVKPTGVGNQNFWFAKNRLYVFSNSQVTALFDSCTSAQITATATSISPGTAVAFTCTTTGNTLAYQWNKNGIAILGATAATYTASSIVGGDVFTCTATIAAACSGNIKMVKVSNSITITFTAPPNDLICNAITLVPDAPSDCRYISGATSAGDPTGNCYGANNTTWYKYVPAASGYVNFKLERHSDGLDVPHIWVGCFVPLSGSCPGAITLADSTAAIFGSGCTMNYLNNLGMGTANWYGYLSAGKTYYFMVSGIYGAVSGYCFSIQSAVQCSGLVGVSANQNPHLLKDINPCANSSNPNYVVKAGAYTFFSAFNGVNRGVGGTGTGSGLYRTDGTDSGTIQLSLTSPGFITSTADFITPLGNKVIFIGDNSPGYYETWVSDGTQAGTIGLEHFVPPGGQMNDRQLIAMGSYIYYTVHTNTGKIQLRRTDGTATGTMLVKEFDTDANGYYGLDVLQVMNGTLYFDYFSPVDGSDQIWKSDGTTAGTVLVKSLGTTAGLASYLMPAGNSLYFVVIGNSWELWKTDGTPAGTLFIRTINPAANQSNAYPAYIAFNDGTANKLILSLSDSTNGREPWISDGTPAGTKPISDIYTGVTASNPIYYTLFGNKVYFSAGNATAGTELWSTDGTTCTLVSDIAIGTTSSAPGPIINCAGRLFFAATSTGAGRELWTSDGTNTSMVKDIYAGTGSSAPVNFSGSAYPLYFSAITAGSGRELYKIEAFDKLWMGSANTSWNNGANWSPVGVPVASDKVLIPQNTATQSVPSVILNTSGTANKIWVNSGNLIIPAGVQLIVH